MKNQDVNIEEYCQLIMITIILGTIEAWIFWKCKEKWNKKGYYPEKFNDIYGEGMKQYVIKFRKDNNLKEYHDINK